MMLKNFSDQAATLPAPQLRLFSWREVAQSLKHVYDTQQANNKPS
jgi:hypothetical protein